MMMDELVRILQDGNYSLVVAGDGIRTFDGRGISDLGNISLPQIFHLIPQGGIIWLPIYFFTLVGAYKYGWKVGLLTAVLSPTVNSLLFGMPMLASLPHRHSGNAFTGIRRMGMY